MKYPNCVFSINILIFGLLSFIAFIMTFIIALSVGSVKINISEILNFLLSSDSLNPVSMVIIRDIRLPRVVMSSMVGASLSLGGLVLQVLLKNPLAEPYILGISGGAAIGAILGILCGLARFPGVTITSFLGSMITVILLTWLSSGNLIFKKESLLLIGVMINSFCSAVIMFLISMVHDSRLNNIMFWLMGDFSMVTLNGMGILTVSFIICFLIIFGCSNCMNLLQLGNDMAKSMGVNVQHISSLLLFCASFMVSITVSYCGLIGFVGLVIPHILRIVLSNDNRILVPACVICGSTYMIICDIIARISLNHGEVPTGVITALIGAPIFIYILLIRSNH